MSQLPRRPLMIILGLLAVAFVSCQIVFPSYGHRYRLTIELEADGTIHKGSSVIDVTWQKQPYFPHMPPFSETVRGHSPVVDLGPRGAVLAALDTYTDKMDQRSVGVQYLALRGFGFFADRPRSFPPTSEGLRALSRFQGWAELKPGNLPLLVWIPDINNVRSARPVEPDAFGAVIGPDVKMRAIMIETTDEPVSRKLPVRAPWVEQLRKPAVNQGPWHTKSFSLPSTIVEN